MQQQPQDMTALSYRITSLEQHVQQLQLELRTYVPARENELQLQSIRYCRADRNRCKRSKKASNGTCR